MSDVSHIATSDAVTVVKKRIFQPRDVHIPASLDVIRALLRRGELKFSTKVPAIVEVVRSLMEEGITAGAAAAELGSGVTKNAVVSFCHRAGITLKQPHGVRTEPRRKVGRRGMSEIIKPVRPPTPAALQRMTEPAPAPVWLLPTNIPYKSEAGQRIARRKRVLARCMWAGCNYEPHAPGKPYCTAHMRMNGSVV